MASTSKVRLAVGLFGTANEFVSALAALGAQGLGSARIKVVARPDAFEGALAGWWEARAFTDWIVCPLDDGAVPSAAAPAGPADPAPSAAADDARALLGFHHGALRRHARQLHRCLEQGGALLLFESDTEAEERTACTALLRYASGGVQTHEIARPQER